MDEKWIKNFDDDFEGHFYTEQDPVKRYKGSLSAQFLQAAWFLRIVPDVYHRFVYFEEKCKELGLEAPVEITKSVMNAIAIEIISPKFGTLHVYGPADYEIAFRGPSKYEVTGPSIRMEGSYFDDVLGTVSNLIEILPDKHLGEILRMNHTGYVRDYHIDLYEARKLEYLSAIFEAWYLSLEELSTNSYEDSSSDTQAYLHTGKGFDLMGKLYLPDTGTEASMFCIVISNEEPFFLDFFPREGENSRIFLRNFSSAMLNPNRP